MLCVFPQDSSGPVESSAEWKLDPAELASKFNSKTKAIFFNTPNNPLGKVSYHMSALFFLFCMYFALNKGPPTILFLSSALSNMQL